MINKGIILAGGTGTRLHPLTKGLSKQLMPIYDKPMIYYPLSTLMLAGIREVLIITTPHEQTLFQELLGDGKSWGLRFEYAVQPSPDGLAQAFMIGEDFIDGDTVCPRARRQRLLRARASRPIDRKAPNKPEGATVFGYYVSNPTAYGVAEFDEDGVVIGLEEKPKEPKSSYAVAGLYFLRSARRGACQGAQTIREGRARDHRSQPQVPRSGQASIAEVRTGCGLARHRDSNGIAPSGQLRSDDSRASRLARLVSGGDFVSVRGWIDADQLARLAKPLEKTEYGQYLHALADGVGHLMKVETSTDPRTFDHRAGRSRRRSRLLHGIVFAGSLRGSGSSKRVRARQRIAFL